MNIDKTLITISDKTGVSITYEVTAKNLLEWHDDKFCPFVDPRDKPIHENPHFITFKNFEQTFPANKRFISEIYHSVVFGTVLQQFYTVDKIPTHPPI